MLNKNKVLLKNTDKKIIVYDNFLKKSKNVLKKMKNEIKRNVEVENYRLSKWILDDYGIVNEVKDGIVVVKEGLNTVGMSEMVVFEKTGMKGIVNFLGKEKSITVLGNIRNIKVGDMVKRLRTLPFVKVSNELNFKRKKLYRLFSKNSKRYYYKNNILLKKEIVSFFKNSKSLGRGSGGDDPFNNRNYKIKNSHEDPIIFVNEGKHRLLKNLLKYHDSKVSLDKKILPDNITGFEKRNVLDFYKKTLTRPIILEKHDFIGTFYSLQTISNISEIWVPDVDLNFIKIKSFGIPCGDNSARFVSPIFYISEEIYNYVLLPYSEGNKVGLNDHKEIIGKFLNHKGLNIYVNFCKENNILLGDPYDFVSFMRDNNNYKDEKFIEYLFIHVFTEKDKEIIRELWHNFKDF